MVRASAIDLQLQDAFLSCDLYHVYAVPYCCEVNAGAARARAAPDGVSVSDGGPERPARALGRVIWPAICHSVRPLGEGAAASCVAACCLLRSSLQLSKRCLR